MHWRLLNQSDKVGRNVFMEQSPVGEFPRSRRRSGHRGEYFILGKELLAFLSDYIRLGLTHESPGLPVWNAIACFHTHSTAAISHDATQSPMRLKVRLDRMVLKAGPQSSTTSSTACLKYFIAATKS